LLDMKYKSIRVGISPQDLAQDRAFWRDLLARHTSSRDLPTHSAGGYPNGGFAVIRDAPWITEQLTRGPVLVDRGHDSVDRGFRPRALARHGVRELDRKPCL
jgi:hypothetical protein